MFYSMRFGKRGEVGGAEEATGAIILEVIAVVLLIGVIVSVVLVKSSSVDPVSYDSFKRFDKIIRQVSLHEESNEVAPIQLDYDYALVVFGKDINSCDKINKPENKCNGEACLCICEPTFVSNMCAGMNNECLKYDFGFAEKCSYFRGKSDAFKIGVRNIKGTIHFSS